MDTFASNLQVLRKSKGLTQDELADELGVRRETVRNWENGTQIPSLGSAVALAKTFSVTLDDLAINPLVLAAVPA